MSSTATTTITSTTPIPYNVTNSSGCSVPICKQILLQDIGGKGIRIWDVSIIVPNILFLIFLLSTIRSARQHLKTSSHPNFRALYILVWISTIVNVTRCIVSIALTGTDNAGSIVDKIFWLLLKFLLLAVELSVLSFAVLFGHLDTASSVRRVFVVTVFCSLVYTTVQSLLEFKYPDSHFRDKYRPEIDLFGHGGMYFWVAASAFFVTLYVSAFIVLVCFKLRYHTAAKCTFFVYCLFMALLNAIQVSGCAMVVAGYISGMCVIDVTTFVYFAFFSIVVYCAFLREFIVSVSAQPYFQYRSDDHYVNSNHPNMISNQLHGIFSPDYDDDYTFSGPQTDDYFAGTDTLSSNPMYNHIYNPEATNLDQQLGLGEAGYPQFSGSAIAGRLVFEGGNTLGMRPYSSREEKLDLPDVVNS